MKRRNFFQSIAGLFALPFVPKAEAKTDNRPVTEALADHLAKKPHTLTAQGRKPATEWWEYKNSGGVIIHKSDPGKIEGSFVVPIAYF
jgi:hypothetical protein